MEMELSYNNTSVRIPFTLLNHYATNTMRTIEKWAEGV